MYVTSKHIPREATHRSNVSQDLLTEMNSYPFLDNKIRPVFTAELGDITRQVRTERVIDISNSPLVPALTLRRKLEYLHDAGEIDGGLPIVRSDILVGLIPAPDLEFGLDKLEKEEDTLCIMATTSLWHDTEEESQERDPTDLTTYIDPVSQCRNHLWTSITD